MNENVNVMKVEHRLGNKEANSRKQYLLS